MSKQQKLETIPLWKSVIKIVDYADGLLPELPEEERWGIESKLRGRALDVTSDVAEAYGSIDPRDKKWLFGLARRDLFGLKSLLKITHKREYTKIDPTIMVAIDEAIEQIDKEIQQASKDIPGWFDEMSPPLKDKKK